MRFKNLIAAICSPSSSKEFPHMKAATAILVSAIAISLPLSASASIDRDADVEVLSEVQLQEIAATGNFPQGYCTWYADQMIRKNWSGTYKKNGTTWQGNAKDWLANAKSKGLKTSGKPAKNAIAVYGPTKTNSYGHVAFVTGVNEKKKTYTITEMNWVGLNKVSTRTLSYGAGGIIGFIKKP